MNRLSCFICMSFMAIAPVLYAQPAINSGAGSGAIASTLPLRNLQIEVRQVQRDDAARAAVEATGTAQMRPGQSGATFGATAQDRTRAQASTSRQQVLVLNGQRATIALRNTVPLRLVQTFLHNGVMVVVPGALLLEAGTGFEATPRWDGQNQVELELAAAQGKGVYHGQTASTSTLLVVPLGEWVTVAQSEQQSTGAHAGLGSSADWTAQSGTEVQVRVSLR
jgi:hypothetical protein